MTDHERRLRNLADAYSVVKDCRRLQFIRDYIPGQVTYNLGEYPNPFSIRPTDYDAELLASFAEHGVGLIQIHEEWSDSQRVLGADKFTSHDPEGLREFVDLVHGLGMKIIPYTSTGFFDVRDPDFREEWFNAERTRLIEVYFDYAHCSPAAPGWREYLLPRLERILDDYGFDGLYDDMGYRDLEHLPVPDGQMRPAPYPHAAIEDLLALVMDLCHDRGGVFKVHGLPADVMREERLYDYLWLGEGVQDLGRMRLDSLRRAPYVVPCPDMSRAQVVDEDELYLHSIPYMQFPLRVDGRPMTGQRALAPGVSYRPVEGCFWSQHCRRIWEHHQANPDGP
ncbi:MAG: hypothetical protein J7M38_00560, partial [Armatimonadetes bacterium]|nr:hypothetical protein [Armatimonadota bacterium]